MRLIRFEPPGLPPSAGAPPDSGEPQGTGAPHEAGETAEVGLLVDGRVLRLSLLWPGNGMGPAPRDAVGLLQGESGAWCRRLADEAPGRHPAAAWLDPAELRLLPPISRPVSFRDFYSFEEHVRTARARRGLTVPPEWYAAPTFYFSNPGALFGSGSEIPHPAATQELDFEMEIGCVLLRGGRDLSPEEAADHIAGYTLLNDWSARDVQRHEMAVGLGPAKGKDFATSLGPVLVTADELAGLRRGRGYDLVLEVRRNGRLLSRGNWSSIHYSFEEMIAHASRDVRLFPGDLFGSGTVGGGCLLELGAEEQGGWLAPGDEIEISAGPLGKLNNRIAAASSGRPADAGNPTKE